MRFLMCLLIFGLLSSSCELVDKLKGVKDSDSATADTGGSSGGSSGGDPAPGGDCSSNLTMAEMGQSGGKTSAAVNSFEVVFTTNNSPNGEEGAVDVSTTTATQNGITYTELVYKGVSGSLDAGTQVAAGFFTTDFSSGMSVIRIFPQSGTLTKNNSSDQITTGVSVSSGYTLGFWLDHATGETFYKDSEGNSGSVDNNASSNLQGQYVITGIAATPPDSIGTTLTAERNVGDSAFSLTPPASALDWCGNSL